ncbi:MAG: ATP synthase F1 subunit delta [Acidobacteriia bacterium]|nr:ATP synthase F1 subunit delta [Terriglobia bacterium]
MIPSAVFARYARALADVALANGEEAEVRRDLDTYREIFRQVPALLEALDSPAVQHEAKGKVLSGLLARYPVSQTVRNFLHILLDHHRILYFAAICDCYVKTVNERKGIVAARVTSAGPLGAQELSALRDSLMRVTGNQVTLSADTDPGLLAGLIVQIGSTVYDGSIRAQLEEMRRRLTRE